MLQSSSISFLKSLPELLLQSLLGLFLWALQFQHLKIHQHKSICLLAAHRSNSQISAIFNIDVFKIDIYIVCIIKMSAVAVQIILYQKEQSDLISTVSILSTSFVQSCFCKNHPLVGFQRPQKVDHCSFDGAQQFSSSDQKHLLLSIFAWNCRGQKEAVY